MQNTRPCVLVNPQTIERFAVVHGARAHGHIGANVDREAV
jgi:hypothetical protein